MLRALIVVFVLAASVSAQGPEPANALRTCVADSTSGKDRKDLATWVFLAIAAHPEMKPYTNASTAAAEDASSERMAALVTRLLTDSCVNETRAVMKVGGAQAVQFAFEGLGQLAMQELMTDQSVKATMGQFERKLDQKRFIETLGGK